MTEQDLLIDCLKRLNESSVEYMLVGSMASNYWASRGRPTKLILSLSTAIPILTLL